VTTAAAEAKAQYSAIVLGATGNVGGRIVQLLIKNPLCKKVVVVTRRKTDAFADPKVSEVVVNMDRLEERLRRTPRESTSRSPRSASARAARRCPRRRCARSKSPTRRPFAAPPRLEALVCAGS
jgi:Semialdehyde dehydrogenase, NAD binding domain.